MKPSPTQENEIISRWTSGQGIRSISRDMSISRHVISRIIAQHVARTRSEQPLALTPRIVRKTKLDQFIDQLHQLLERYPGLTVQRTYEELRGLGYAGSYSTVRAYLKTYRPKTKPPTVRFETAPGAQAQMDWSTYTIDFQQEGRRRAGTSQESAIQSRIKRAAFPTEATLESYDWTRSPKSIRKETFLELASAQFILRKENVAFVGASGLGKTHLIQAVGRKCCALGYRVRYETSASLIETLNKARAIKALTPKVKKYCSYDLLVIDEFGFESLRGRKSPRR